MPHCNINLAKGIIWSRWKRRLAYRIIIIYLFTMTLLMVSMASRAVQKIHDGVQYYRQSRAMEQEFIQVHPNAADLLNYAEDLKKQIDQSAARIESIRETLPESLHSALPALVLLANHSDKSTLHKLAFSQQSPQEPMKLSFDLIVPEYIARNGSPSQSFVQEWQKDPLLAEHFSELKPVRSRRETLNGKPVFITQYEATNKD
jgi:hypothetical protein